MAYCDSALPSSASNIAYFQQDACQTAPERENEGEKGHAFPSSSLHFHQFPLCLNPHLLFSSPRPSPHHSSSAYAMLAQFSWRRMWEKRARNAEGTGGRERRRGRHHVENKLSLHQHHPVVPVVICAFCFSPTHLERSEGLVFLSVMHIATSQLTS